MKIKIYLFIVSTLIFVNLISAQNRVDKNKGTIEIIGSVADQSGKALPGVVITIDEGAAQTVTDKNGRFQILGKPSSMILFELPGYEDILISYSDFRNKGNVVTLVSGSLFSGEVNMPFRIQKYFQTVGNLSVIDPRKEFNRDSRSNLSSVIDGKIAGSSGGLNIDFMASTVVVDGIPTLNYSYLDLREIEQITILKDIASRILYGARGNNTIILVTTKGGSKNKKTLKFDVEYGINQAIGYPDFLNAPQYMSTFNKAWANDGGTGDAPYSQDIIDKTKDGTNPVLFPDNNYYGSDYVKNFSHARSLYIETSGGNDAFQYFMDLSWRNSDNFIRLNTNVNNSLKARGKIDAKITNWLKATVNSLATYDLSAGPNGASSFWSKASTFLPNTTPVLIPISRISNYSDISSPRLVNKGGVDYLLGGTQTYQDNLFGDQMMQGTVNSMNRYLLFNTILNFNLNGITKGLSARGMFNFDARDTYNTYVRSDYAIYQIDKNSIDPAGQFMVTRIGEDQITNKQTIEEAGVNFNRNYTWNTSINYDRTFGKNYVSSVLVGWGNHQEEKLVDQPDKNLGFGLQATYMFDEKYQIDAGLVFQGSYRVAPEHKWGSSPSIGLGWMISNEKFMKDISFIDFLKLHASFGVIENDDWTSGGYNGYFLNETNYVRSGGYAWNNGLSSGTATHLSSVDNKLDWSKRNEWVFGVESSVLNKSLWVNASYFNSLSYDNLTSINAIAPALMGEITLYRNYNANRNQGVEIGIKYKTKIDEIKFDLGLNYTFSDMSYVKYAQAPQTSPYDKHLTREGTSARALWGMASQGFYMPSDFGTDGKLLPSLPENTLDPNVNVGDLKYLDYNNDGKITTDDQHILARNSLNNNQLGLTIDVQYDNWELFALFIGQFGGKGSIGQDADSDYYWFTGNNAKYSKIALDAFDPNNPNPNALYPRLTLGDGTHNYRISSFWMYDRSYISLSSMQLAYNFRFKNAFIKSVKSYLRGSNLVTVAKEKEILELSYQSAPQNRNFAIGLIATF